MDFLYTADFWFLIVGFLCDPHPTFREFMGTSRHMLQLRLVSKTLKSYIESKHFAQLYYLTLDRQEDIPKARLLLPHSRIKVSKADPCFIQSRPDGVMFECEEYWDGYQILGIDSDSAEIQYYDIITSIWTPSRNVAQFCYCQVLSLAIYDITDISPLTYLPLRELEIRRFSGESVSCLAQIPNLRILSLRNCHNITVVSMFNRLRELTIAYCDKIVSVTGLSNIPVLSLNYLNIVDVSTLKRVRQLSLESCEKITDVSALGNVWNLSLRGCTGIRNVSMLGKARYLDLSHTSISDISMLGNVYSLDLSYTSISDVSMLGNLCCLYLKGTPVSDVSALSSVGVLNLEDTLVTDVSMLKGVGILKLSTATHGAEKLTKTQIILNSDSSYSSDEV